MISTFFLGDFFSPRLNLCIVVGCSEKPAMKPSVRRMEGNNLLERTYYAFLYDTVSARLIPVISPHFTYLSVFFFGVLQSEREQSKIDEVNCVHPHLNSQFNVGF